MNLGNVTDCSTEKRCYCAINGPRTQGLAAGHLWLDCVTETMRAYFQMKVTNEELKEGVKAKPTEMHL